MAETSGSGGVGALSIAGVATVVVIVGGVVLTQLGVFDGTDDVAETPVVTEQPASETPTEPSPSAVTSEDAPSAPAPTAPQPSAAQTSTPAEPAPTTPSQPVETAEPAAPQEGGPAQAQSESDTPEVIAQTTPAPVDVEPAQPSPEDATVNQQAATSDTPQPTLDVTEAETTAETRPQQVAPAPEDAATDTTQETADALPAPEIDVIRFDPDGAGLIAGRAVVGARVLILLDGIVIEEVTTSGSGEFVAFPVVEPSAAPRVVTVAAGKGGEIVTSDVSFILAPVTPVAVAEAEPTAPPVAADVAEAAPVATADVESATQEAAEGASAVDQPAEIAPPAVDELLSEPVQLAEAEDTAPVETPQAAPDGAQAETATTEETPPVAAVDVVPPVVPSVPDTPEIDTDAVADVAQDSTAAPAEAATSTPQEPDDEGTQTLALLQTQKAAETPAAPDLVADPSDQPIAAQEPEAPKPQSAAIAVLRAGPEGVEVVQPVAPSTPELADKVALDAISYTPTGDVVLTGRARPAALVRVYIDNTPVVDVRTNVSGRWRTGLDGVAPGIYTLRLDEIDPLEGKVLSRLETPFKREAPEVLVQPTPEPGAPEVATTVRAVTVQKGDTLWAISRDRYGDGFLFVRVFEANKDAIKDPDLIYPGQIFNLPE